jgi:sugar/nucleoside kinase (ribokinase family)
MDHESISKKVVTLGDFVADLVVSIPSLPVEPEGHQLASSIVVEPGGAGNLVIAGSRLGLDMRLLGVRGADSLGQMAASALENEGIDTTGLICQEDGSTTTVVVLVDEAGRHVFLGKYGTGPEVEVLPAWLEQIGTASALFVSGYALLEARLAKAAQACLQFANGHHIPVFFDPGPRVLGMPERLIQGVLEKTTVLLLTEEEILLAAQGKTGLEACPMLLKAGLDLVCVKRGPKGCVIFAPDQEIQHPGYPVDARDTNAAGDAFDAAFIYGYLSGWPLDRVAAFANAMGAAKVKKPGSGTHVPTLEEILDVLQSHQSQIPF